MTQIDAMVPSAPAGAPAIHHTPAPSPAAVYLASLGSEKSRRAMRGALRLIAAELDSTPEALPWSALRYEHVTALRARLAERHAPATTNHALSALRGVMREAMRLGLISAEDCARACDVKAVRGSRLPAGRALERGELRALLSTASARDAAIVATLYGCGLRRAELAALDLDHIDGTAVKVIGKGNKERIVYLPAGAALAIDRWLAVRGRDPGPLFVSLDRGGEITARRLGESSISFILGQLAEQAGVRSFSPHDMRRTFISDALDAGADIATVQALAGHASVVTTARYDRRGERAKQRASGLIDVPISG